MFDDWFATVESNGEPPDPASTIWQELFGDDLNYFDQSWHDDDVQTGEGALTAEELNAWRESTVAAAMDRRYRFPKREHTTLNYPTVTIKQEPTTQPELVAQREFVAHREPTLQRESAEQRETLVPPPLPTPTTQSTTFSQRLFIYFKDTTVVVVIHIPSAFTWRVLPLMNRLLRECG